MEDIAEAAGISRRTFFNYFGSTEAALASVTHGFLDTALQQFRLRPPANPSWNRRGRPWLNWPTP